MSRSPIDQYCGRVGKNLLCTPETRKELLSGLREELSTLPPEDVSSIEALERRYGKIQKITIELQEAVPCGESFLVLQQQRRSFRRWLAAGVICMLLCFVIIWFLFFEMPIISISETPVVVP